MKIQLITVFDQEFQAQAEFHYTNKDGQDRTIQARPAHTSTCALVELMDGSGCRVVVEFPAYGRKLNPGDILFVECPALADLDKAWLVRNITRYEAGKK